MGRPRESPRIPVRVAGRGCQRTLPGLQDYILVSSQTYLVEVFHRTQGDRWLLDTYQGIEAIARIESLNLDAPLADIYASLDLSRIAREEAPEQHR